MNKNRSLLIASLVLIISTMTWSCKDEFSAEDQLRLQAELDEQARQNALDDAQEKDSTSISILAYNASISTHSSGGRTSDIKGVSGISIKISAGGEILTQTTNADGIANFWVQPGVLSGTVSGTGFATANFTITLSEGEDGEGGEFGEQATGASVVLPIFANTGSTTARVTGTVTYQGNLLNSTQEFVPNGTGVTFRPDPAAIQQYYTVVNSGQADIDAYSFEGTFFTTTTNGVYSINLPAGVNGLAYTYAFNEFTADQSIAINNYVNEAAGSVRDVVNIRTNFGQSISGAYTDPPVVLPVQFDIQAPPPSGTGATVSLRLWPWDVTGQSLTDYEVLAGGTGYPPNNNNIPVTINGGDYDPAVPGATPAAIVATSNALGQIVSITINDVGYAYRSRATLTIGGGGSGAIVRLNYVSNIVPEYFAWNPSIITSGGSGYLNSNPPTILVTALNVEGEVTTFSNPTLVADGSVVGVEPNFVDYVSSITSAVVVPPARAQATASNYTLSSLGELSTVSLGNDGLGYANSPAPTVTVRGLRGGSGAIVTAEVNQTEVVNGLNVVSRGSGYSLLANANFPAVQESFTPNSAALTLVAGQEKVLDTYYGTGRRTRQVE